MTENLLASAAPVFLVDGQRKGELARDLLRLDIEETTAGLKTLSLRLLAQGPAGSSASEQLLYLDGSVFDFGRELQVSLGPDSEARTVFTGFISAIEADFDEGREPEVAVFAEDRLMDLRMTRRSRTYENLTDASIASEIAREHNLTADTDADGPTYDVVEQFNQSDLAFLRDRARLIQAEIWFADGKLCFKTRERRTATQLTLVQGNHILSLGARADLAHQRTKVRIAGYDAGRREAIDEEAGDDAVQAEIAGGRTGASILEGAFGERVSHRVREAPLNVEEARSWARAEMLRRARAFVAVQGVTRGSADMVVGSRLTLERVGRPFEGSGYYVTRVRHSYDLENGFRTRFEAERATIQEGA